MPPDGRAETEDTKQYKHTGACHDQPTRQDVYQECFRADAACHRNKTRAHPRGIRAFGSEYGAVGGEFSPPVGAVLDTRRTALHVGGTVLYADGAVLELVAVLDDLWFCGHAL